MKKVKKKLFIAGAYLLIAAALLAYVTYAAYRINIGAVVELPKAKQMTASIDLDYDLLKMATDSQISTGSEIILAELLPGENVDDYANQPSLAETKGRVLHLSVSNRGKDEAEIASKSFIDMDFRIEINETGPVPLHMILVDDEGKQYTAKSAILNKSTKTLSKNLNYGMQTIVFKDADGKEPLFHFDNAVQREFNIYFGWNNDNDKDNDSDNYNSITSRGKTRSVYQLQKELSVIEVRVSAIGRPYQIEEFTNVVATQSNADSPADSPEP